MTGHFRICIRRSLMFFGWCLLSVLVAGCTSNTVGRVATEPSIASMGLSDVTDISVVVKRRSDLNFVPLNPARKDASPQAGVLWGDITQDLPSGVLLQFSDGFSSPPHIHNITYRAVVISGELHNDDPDAAPFWMGPTSYWVQPAGELHVTAARKGAGATAFLEILSGPYLVKPASYAFDNGERPLNQDAKNRVWLDRSVTHWIDERSFASNTTAGPQLSPLWGSMSADNLNGSLVRLPRQFEGTLTGSGSRLRGVVIQGQITHDVAALSMPQELKPGSLFASTGPVSHGVKCGRSECVIYVRTKGAYRLAATGQ